MPGGAIVIPAGQLRSAAFRAAGHPLPPQMEGAGPCPTSGIPTHAMPSARLMSSPTLAPDDHDDDHTKEVMLKDHRGHLRPPAYLLIALVTALAAVLLLTVAMLIAPR